MGEKGNVNAEKHGGASAIKSIQYNEPFTGIASSVQASVQDEYSTVGATGLLERDAIRLQVAADCYWQAFCGASEAHDYEKMTLYLKTWGWLMNSAIRALALVKDAKKKEDVVDVTELLKVYRSDQDA